MSARGHYIKITGLVNIPTVIFVVTGEIAGIEGVMIHSGHDLI